MASSSQIGPIGLSGSPGVRNASRIRVSKLCGAVSRATSISSTNPQTPTPAMSAANSTLNSMRRQNGRLLGIIRLPQMYKERLPCTEIGPDGDQRDCHNGKY